MRVLQRWDREPTRTPLTLRTSPGQRKARRQRKTCSIRAMTSGVRCGMRSMALRFSRSWAGPLAPTMTLDTARFMVHHAIASCATLQPRSEATVHQGFHLRVAVRVHQGPAKPVVPRKGTTTAGRNAVPVLAGEHARGQWAPGHQPEAELGLQLEIVLLDPTACEQVVLRLLDDRLAQSVPVGEVPGCPHVLGWPLRGPPVQGLPRRRRCPTSSRRSRRSESRGRVDGTGAGRRTVSAASPDTRRCPA